MSALSVIRGGIVGAVTLAVPAAGLAFACLSLLGGQGYFAGILCLVYLLVCGCTWMCVRVAHFPHWVAVVLASLPFFTALLTTYRDVGEGYFGGFGLWFTLLAIAASVAEVGGRLGRRRVASPVAPDVEPGIATSHMEQP